MTETFSCSACNANFQTNAEGQPEIGWLFVCTECSAVCRITHMHNFKGTRVLAMVDPDMWPDIEPVKPGDARYDEAVALLAG